MRQIALGMSRSSRLHLPYIKYKIIDDGICHIKDDKGSRLPLPQSVLKCQLDKQENFDAEASIDPQFNYKCICNGQGVLEIKYKQHG